MNGHDQWWKILGLLVLVVVALGSIGAYSVYNRPPTMSLTSTSTGSATTSLQLPTASTTLSASLTPIQWITVENVRPVSYYLSLLESNGTQPYVQLANEIQKLPEFAFGNIQPANATALAEITYLALNATNPEVKEAFELMMKGGTPDQNDFQYSVPSYNTELEVLYWLACQNRFKKDDSLALAIAIVNGLWVTMGDQQVSQAVYSGTSQLLSFFRETNELQKMHGYYTLEDYPLEAKLLLSWTAGLAVAGPSDQPYRLENFRKTKLTLQAYEWNTVSVDTLRRMQVLVDNDWIDRNVTLTFSRMEEYFYFSGFELHMDYQATPGTILVDNVTVPNRHLNNVNWEFQHFEETGRILGVCNEEATFVDALSKSVGIATTEVNVNWKTDGHTFAIYFDPTTNEWKMYPKQMLNINISNSEPIYALVFRAPVYEGFSYRTFTTFSQSSLVVGYPFYLVLGQREDIASYFVQGLPTQTFAQWMFSLQ